MYIYIWFRTCRGTAYCTWSVISSHESEFLIPFSDFLRHGSVKRDLTDRELRMGFEDSLSGIGASVQKATAHSTD